MNCTVKPALFPALNNYYALIIALRNGVLLSWLTKVI
jgi:hypothetical protein